jgi:hypothetical protein
MIELIRQIIDAKGHLPVAARTRRQRRIAVTSVKSYIIHRQAARRRFGVWVV